MNTSSLAIWPIILSEPSMAAYTKEQRPRTGVVKLMPPPTPPDEATIRKLNDLAAKQPFCAKHRVKKHDML
jgi:hypothetical protein